MQSTSDRCSSLRWLSMLAMFVARCGQLAAANFPGAESLTFIDRNCSSCHNDVDKEAGLDLTNLNFEPGDPANFATWVKVHDRVQAGEMPPQEKKRPEAKSLAGFVGDLRHELVAAENITTAASGRAVRRRLNRAEYENSLRDLLQAPWLQIRDQLPEDGEAFRYNKIGSALDISYVHMTRYMGAAEYALRQAMSVQYTRPPTTTTRYYAREDPSMQVFSYTFGAHWPDRKKFPLLDWTAAPDVRLGKVPVSVGGADATTRDHEAIAWISSNYVTGFGSSWSSFRSPVAGRYRLRFSGYSIWMGGGGRRQMYIDGQDTTGTPGQPDWFRPHADKIAMGRRDEGITVYAQGGLENRRLGGFDVTPEPGVTDLGELWLLGGENIVTDSARFYRSRPTGFQTGFTNPLAQRDGMPGVAFRWIEVEGPLYDSSSGAGYRLMFGDLPIRKVEPTAAGVLVDVVTGGGRGRGRGGRAQGGGGGFGAQAGLPPNTEKVDVVSANPAQDAERLLRAFMQRAYRRPVQEKDVQRFLELIKQRMAIGLGFAGSMLAGYTAVLSSPEFVFVDDAPGRLNDEALATRLALFLWNSEPDEALRQRARQGELHHPDALRAETERLLKDDKARHFVNAFLDYWLDLRKMDDTTPSTTLYNDYYLDDTLTEAAVDETQLFFAEMLRANLPARNSVDSDFTYLNERLAQHYGIAGVNGIAMRRVTLPADTVRGGFMTQASVLKVTANGTTTSPVLRGKWIMERILGFDLPPPPASVPAVEPDIRGAVTIRQQLDKHRADESCAMCHRKIDPPGFALESFDVMGGWRERYRGNSSDADPEKGFGKNGWPYTFNYTLPVDATGQLVDGRSFKDVRDFKQLLLKDETVLARNIARQLTIYATGAPIRFSDREEIERIIERAKASHYGVRDIVHAIIQSDLFRNK